MIRIRTASLDDVQDVSKLVEAGADEGALLIRKNRELKALARKKNVIAAFDHDKIVGIAILDFYSKRLTELRSLYVKQEYRNRGIGRRLVRNVMKRARSLGVEELMTITLRGNKDWFTKRGFGEDPHGFKVALFKKL